MPALSLALALSLAADPCRASFSPGLRERSAAPNFAGMPGIVEVPIAAAAPEGDIWYAYNDATRLYATVPPIRSQANAFVTIGLLPRLTVSARGSDTRAGRAVDHLNRDLSASAQLLLLRETWLRPSLMVGLQDISGANAIYEARVVAATKSIAGRLRVTAGYGEGFTLLDGAFGGVELAPCHWVSLLAEHDGMQRSVGVRLTPFPSFTDRRGMRLTLDVVRRGETGTSIGVGLRTSLDRPRDEALARALAPTRARGSLEAVRERLIAAGLENVRVGATDPATLSVHYENRRFNRDEMDALGVVLGIAADAAPSEVQSLHVTVRKLDIPVLSVRTQRAALQRYLDDPRAEERFVEQLIVEDASLAPSDAHQERPRNRTRLRLDLGAAPRIDNNLMTETGVLETQIALLPEATMQLGTGLALSGRRAVVLRTSREFFSEERELNADRLLLHHGVRIPRRLLPRGMTGVGQLSVGRFGSHEVGALWDQDLLLRNGRWSIGGQVGVFDRSLEALERSVGILTLRWRDPARGTVVALSGGRFLRGDVGGAAELTRRFGLTELGFFLRSSDLSNEGGVRVGIPLAPRREMKPAFVRARMPAFWEQTQRIRLFEAIPYLPVGVAQPLESGHEVVRVYGGRDWMRPEVVRTRAAVLRDAALRWGGE